MCNDDKKLTNTGYPHIDNVHKKYYEGIKSNAVDTSMSMYRYLLANTEGFDGTAISFYGDDISYNDMKLKILKYAKSFYHMGVKPGDVVTFLMPSCPETYYMFYALDVIGAKRNMVDLRTSVDGLQKYINEAESQYFVCMENFPPNQAKKLMDKTSTKRVLLAKVPYNALGGKLKQNVAKGIMNLSEFGYKKLGDEILLLDDFKDYYKYVSSDTNVEQEIKTNEPSMYVHTSGTMSFPKTVMVSDEQQNFVSEQYKKSLIPFDPHDRFLAIMPPWIIYGILAIHTSFATKMTVYPVLDPSNEKFDELVLKTKANHVAGVPNHYITLLESPLITPETDLSFAKTYACGGAPINSEKQNEVNEFLKAHGSKGKLSPGYSFSENNSIGTVNQDPYNKLGSVGILLPDLEAMVIDKDTGEPLKFNQEGIICLRGSIMNGYLNDEDETNKVIKNIDGKDWAVSGDIGYFDEEGFLFISGRQKNLIIKPDGFKIAPNEIESKICSHPAVKNCIVFGVRDSEYEFGDSPIAYVELKDNNISRLQKNKIFAEIKDICEKQLSTYYRPKAFYCGEIIYTPMMKDDKKAMSQKYQEEAQKSLVKRKIFGSNIYE